MGRDIASEIDVFASHFYSGEATDSSLPSVKIERGMKSSRLEISALVGGGEQRGYEVRVSINSDELRRLAELVTRDELKFLRKIVDRKL